MGRKGGALGSGSPCSMFMAMEPISRGDIPGGRGDVGGAGGWAWRCTGIVTYKEATVWMVWSGLFLFSQQKHGDFSEDHLG